MDDNYDNSDRRTWQVLRSQRYRGIWSIHLSGILGEEWRLQLAEVDHRGIWSIHLNGPSGEESHHVLGFFSAKAFICQRLGFGFDGTLMKGVC